MIDSHAHLGSFDAQDALQIIENAHKANIEAIINIATDKETLQYGLTLRTREKPSIFLVAATTPHDVEKEGDLFFPIVVDAVEKNQLVAIGETGLDYHYLHSPKELQQKFLEKYLLLAKAKNLPVVIHCREAFQDLFSLVDEVAPTVPLLLHCFTGTQKEADECLKRNWKISISGIVTFPKSHELQTIAQTIPLSSLMIETDAPYLAPHPYRGKRNEPKFLIETARMIAQVKNISLEEVMYQTSQTTKNFFHVSTTNSTL